MNIIRLSPLIILLTSRHDRLMSPIHFRAMATIQARKCHHDVQMRHTPRITSARHIAVITTTGVTSITHQTLYYDVSM
jgi:hypothetical protein